MVRVHMKSRTVLKSEGCDAFPLFFGLVSLLDLVFVLIYRGVAQALHSNHSFWQWLLDGAGVCHGFFRIYPRRVSFHRYDIFFYFFLKKYIFGICVLMLADSHSCD